jgi:ABC-type sugar transport system substrate-binding protein
MFGMIDDVALGMLTAATESGRTDPNKLFIASPNGTPPAIQKIQAGTVLQATTEFSYRYSATAWEFQVEDGLLGQHVQPTCLLRAYLISKDNAAAELAALENPLASDNRHRLDTTLVCFNQPLTEGAPLPIIPPA